MSPFRRSTFIIAALFVSAFAATESLAKPVKVKGFGLFGNAELRSALTLLDIGDGDLSAQKMDDGAFLLLTRLTQNGYLDATVSAEYEMEDGSINDVEWRAPFEAKIPEDVVAQKIRYTVNPNTLYYYDTVEIEGLSSIDTDEAKAYIIPDTALYSRKKDKSYSPNIVSNHQKQLAAVLATLGRIDAKVTIKSTDIDRETGAVDVVFSVNEGPLYEIEQVEIHYLEKEKEPEIEQLEVDRVYTRTWVEDQIRNLRNKSYNLGYPDTSVSSRIAKSEPEGDTIQVYLQFDVRRGAKYTLSGVEHVGATDTHTPLLNRKADLEIGEELDITETEAARRNLSRLGIFDRIDLRYEDDGEGQRKAVYEYTNGDRVQAQLLFGYGSYEQFRGGFLAERDNLFGRAHTLSFSAIQSLKSTSGGIDYTVPDIFGENITGTFELNYLDRQEINFDRTEQGVTLGLFTRLTKLKVDVGLDYAFELKESSNPELGEELGLGEANVGSISLRASRSTLDNLLYPTDGYELTGTIQYAGTSLGGETDFIKPELSAAIHQRVGSRWIFHLGARGGIIGDNAENLSYSDRFIVGGENSIRGYRRGGAAPIVDGNLKNPLAYAQLNMEVEYPILDQLNVVLFSDSLRTWVDEVSMDNYIYEDLFSVGLGLRYNTIIGPVRLEYGHNLNPRPEDPEGTFHLSIGFPF
ncbi:BamA/TamA family outer membrane protein [Pelagicoccus albus]|uniref:BamA/TamA family outer membrane protein n=1 Tax=Pelagicoccus albus TaxID=415222 RepID=A0A7X1EAQ4_9BACT|nr:BamA/TamA family outer membrane protein [Pelagicoccus albus]